MNARESILRRVRAASGRASETSPDVATSSNVVSGNFSDSGNDSSNKRSRAQLLAMLPESVQQRLGNPRPLTQPQIQKDGKDATEKLISQMESVQMSVVRLQSTADVVAAVDWYLQDQGIEGELTVGPSLNALDWPAQTRFGPASGTESTSVTTALAAVAETGSIALASDEQTPTTLNFLPENHIVVLHESQIVDRMEDVWTQLRSMPGIPRAVNLVTGPSRTGDIEQTIELGAHGPRRMHVLLVAAS